MKILLLLLLIGTSATAFGQQNQPFFGRLNPPASLRSHTAVSPFSVSPHVAILDSATTPLPDSTFSGWRFEGPSVVYGYTTGSNSLMTGIGVGYEHDTYNPSTGIWYTNYAIGPMVYGGGMVAPSSFSGVIAAGVQGSFLNRHVTVGIGYNFIAKGVLYVAGTTFDLNNN